MNGIVCTLTEMQCKNNPGQFCSNVIHLNNTADRTITCYFTIYIIRSETPLGHLYLLHEYTNEHLTTVKPV